MSKARTQAEGALENTPENTALPMQLDARIHRINPTGYVRATASVNMNGCFAVRNVKVMDGTNGMYVAMPSYAVQSTGEYKEHCFPVTKEFREQLHGAVMDAYHQALTQSHESALQGQPQPGLDRGDLPFDLDDPGDGEPDESHQREHELAPAPAMSGIGM